FGPILCLLPWSGRRRIDTSQPLPPNLPFVRSTQPSVVQGRRSLAPPCDARTFRRSVARVLHRSTGYGFVAREKSPCLYPYSCRANYPPASTHRFSWTHGRPRLCPDEGLRHPVD